jgi:hypothetical protein
VIAAVVIIDAITRQHRPRAQARLSPRSISRWMSASVICGRQQTSHALIATPMPHPAMGNIGQTHVENPELSIALLDAYR